MAKKARQRLSKSAAAYKSEISRIKSAITRAKSQGWKLPSYDVSYYVPEKPKIIRPSDVKKLGSIDYDRIIKQGTKPFYSGKGFFKENLSYTEYKAAQKESRSRARKTKYWAKKGASIYWDISGNEIVLKNGQPIRENGKPLPFSDIEPPEPPDITPPEPPDIEDDYEPYEYRQQPGDNAEEYQAEDTYDVKDAETVSQAVVIIDNLRDDLKGIFDFHSKEPKFLYNRDWMDVLTKTYSAIDGALLTAKRNNDVVFAKYVIDNVWKFEDASQKYDFELYGSDPALVEFSATLYIQLLEQGLGTSVISLRNLSDLDDSLNDFIVYD